MLWKPAEKKILGRDTGPLPKTGAHPLSEPHPWPPLVAHIYLPLFNFEMLAGMVVVVLCQRVEILFWTD